MRLLPSDVRLPDPATEITVYQNGPYASPALCQKTRSERDPRRKSRIVVNPGKGSGCSEDPVPQGGMRRWRAVGLRGRRLSGGFVERACALDVLVGGFPALGAGMVRARRSGLPARTAAWRACFFRTRGPIGPLLQCLLPPPNHPWDRPPGGRPQSPRSLAGFSWKVAASFT